MSAGTVWRAKRPFRLDPNTIGPGHVLPIVSASVFDQGSETLLRAPIVDLTVGVVDSLDFTFLAPLLEQHNPGAKPEWSFTSLFAPGLKWQSEARCPLGGVVSGLGGHGQDRGLRGDQHRHREPRYSTPRCVRDGLCFVWCRPSRGPWLSRGPVHVFHALTSSSRLRLQASTQPRNQPTCQQNLALTRRECMAQLNGLPVDLRVHSIAMLHSLS